MGQKEFKSSIVRLIIADDENHDAIADLSRAQHARDEAIGDVPGYEHQRLRALDVGMVVDPFQATGKDAYVDVLEAASREAIPWREARRGLSIMLDGVEISVLHPDGPTPDSFGGTDANAQSVILLVRYGEFEALLTGDAPVEAEEAILADLPTNLEVLKVGHHGSNTSTSPLLLAQTSPELAVISVGARNRYGHPHDDVVDRILQSGARLLRTDLSGDIVIRARRSGLYDVRAEW